MLMACGNRCAPSRLLPMFLHPRLLAVGRLPLLPQWHGQLLLLLLLRLLLLLLQLLLLARSPSCINQHCCLLFLCFFYCCLPTRPAALA